MNSKNTTQKIFSLVLRKFRHSHNLTQEALAELVGVSTSYIGMLEVGKRAPNIEMLFRISDAFNVGPDEIVKAMDEARNAKK